MICYTFLGEVDYTLILLAWAVKEFIKRGWDLSCLTREPTFFAVLSRGLVSEGLFFFTSPG